MTHAESSTVSQERTDCTPIHSTIAIPGPIARLSHAHIMIDIFGTAAQLSPGRVNALRPRQNGRHFPDHIYKCIFLNETIWMSIKISLKFVLKGQINSISSLVQIMAWRRPGDKPLSEPMMVNYRCIYASRGLGELKVNLSPVSVITSFWDTPCDPLYSITLHHCENRHFSVSNTINVLFDEQL